MTDSQPLQVQHELQISVSQQEQKEPLLAPQEEEHPEVQHSRDKVRKADEIVKKLAADDIELDIYEVTAIYTKLRGLMADHTLSEHPTEMEKQLKEGKFKILEYINYVHANAAFAAVTCACAQILGIVVILYHVISQEVIKDGGGFCRLDWTENFGMRILSTLGQLFLIRFEQTSYDSNKEKSLQLWYSFGLLNCLLKNFKKRKNSKLPLAVYDVYWVTIGMRVNAFVYETAMITSAFLIYATTNPTDLILNGVALFFMVEMDNILVGAQDKKRIRAGLDLIRDSSEYVKPKTLEEIKFNKCCDILNAIFADIYWPVSSSAYLVGLYLVPCWNFICY